MYIYVYIYICIYISKYKSILWEIWMHNVSSIHSLPAGPPFGPVLQCVAVCCSVLQCVAACCSVLQRVAACCSVLQRAAACCSDITILLLSPLFLRNSLKKMTTEFTSEFSPNAATSHADAVHIILNIDIILLLNSLKKMTTEFPSENFYLMLPLHIQTRCTLF